MPALIDREGRRIDLGPLTSTYRSRGLGRYGAGLGLLKPKPPFTYWTAEAMLQDPMINLGMAMRRSFVSPAGFPLDPENPEEGYAGFSVLSNNNNLKKFVETEISNVWAKGFQVILKTMAYGVQPCEIGVERDHKSDLVKFDNLYPVRPIDAELYTKKNRPYMISVSGVSGGGSGTINIYAPQAAWFVNRPEYNAWWGQSELYPSYEPWLNKVGEGGATDVRTLAMYKDAYGGDILWYPDEMIPMDDGEVHASVVADGVVQKRASGATMTMINDRYPDKDGNPNGPKKWEYTEPKTFGSKSEILEYVRTLDVEIMAGLLNPDGLANESVGGTMGTAGGRKVLIEVAYQVAIEWWQCILPQIVKQIVDPLVVWNFGRDEKYQVQALHFHDRLQEYNTKKQMEQGQGQGQEGMMPGMEGGGQGGNPFADTMGGQDNQQQENQQGDYQFSLNHIARQMRAMEDSLSPTGIQRMATAKEVNNAAKLVAVPTEGQAEAGNYAKGHVRVNGLDIAIETARGKPRVGWEIPLSCHYGYIKRTRGADDDHVDAFIGANPESEYVLVIDQVDQNGRFDEHKVMLGFSNKKEAIEAYSANYPTGFRVGESCPMTLGDFKDWLVDGDTSKPVCKQSLSIPYSPRQVVKVRPSGVLA